MLKIDVFIFFITHMVPVNHGYCFIIGKNLFFCLKVSFTLIPYHEVVERALWQDKVMHQSTIHVNR